MKGQNFVLDSVRALYQWAADPDRSRLLPAGFRNPFCRRVIERRRVVRDLASEPDITLAMAEQFLWACDDWQLRLFAPLVFYGLRPSELIYLFQEELEERTLNVCCIEPLVYLTKGRRNKRLPLLPPIYRLLRSHAPPAPQGLIYCQRQATKTDERFPLLGQSLKDLTKEFEGRVDGIADAQDLIKKRDEVLGDAGALTYKMIEGQFAGIAKTLHWPPAATLKDLRHLCNTALANGGMTEAERRYLLGQDPGKAAIVSYTHLNKLAEHYSQAVEREMKPLLQVLEQRFTRTKAA